MSEDAAKYGLRPGKKGRPRVDRYGKLYAFRASRDNETWIESMKERGYGVTEVINNLIEMARRLS